MSCLKTLDSDFSKCYDKCEGIDVISFDKEETDSRPQKYELDKNPTLTRFINKLCNQYNKYKDTYNFPTKYKGITQL